MGCSIIISIPSSPVNVPVPIYTLGCRESVFPKTTTQYPQGWNLIPCSIGKYTNHETTVPSPLRMQVKLQAKCDHQPLWERRKLSLTPSCLYSFYLGKWILRRDFIEDSRKAGKWLDEQLYEWNEQCTAEGILTAHLLAPSRWRRILQQSKGPFVGWKALVAVADAKKRAAYKMYVSLHLSLINQSLINRA